MWLCFGHCKSLCNEALTTGSFPDSLKCANVRPIYKKVDPFDKTIYRPVSTLPLLSKILKERYTSKRQIILGVFSMKFCVDST